jgi:ABC-type transport system involved in cytochrome bd biosynthesis fused ATPase/permease subunit
VLLITHERHGIDQFDEVLTLRDGRLERAADADRNPVVESGDRQSSLPRARDAPAC